MIGHESIMFMCIYYDKHYHIFMSPIHYWKTGICLKHDISIPAQSDQNTRYERDGYWHLDLHPISCSNSLQCGFNEKRNIQIFTSYVYLIFGHLSWYGFSNFIQNKLIFYENNVSNDILIPVLMVYVLCIWILRNMK